MHTNGVEDNICARANRRNIGGGTRSDAFLGLAKICARLGVSFRDDLGHRLRVRGAPMRPALPGLIRLRATA